MLRHSLSFDNVKRALAVYLDGVTYAIAALIYTASFVALMVMMRRRGELSNILSHGWVGWLMLGATLVLAPYFLLCYLRDRAFDAWSRGDER
jgi:hypothetical protein